MRFFNICAAIVFVFFTEIAFADVYKLYRYDGSGNKLYIGVSKTSCPSLGYLVSFSEGNIADYYTDFTIVASGDLFDVELDVDTCSYGPNVVYSNSVS